MYEAEPGEYASAGAGGADAVDGPYGMNTPWISVSFGTTLFLFVVFMFFITIVMLNLLIAIMGDIFGKIQENANAEFMFARAGIIVEIKNMLNDRDKKREDWFPTWLQVLVSSLDDDSSSNND